MQDRATDLLPSGALGAGEDADDEVYEQVRQRVQALISAARELSDTCADLADALRPLPGSGPDDPFAHGFGGLRAERTAALLDEAASAARGTLGLLHSAYGALERQIGRPPAAESRSGSPGSRGGASTWPDAFVETPPRSFTVEDEAGTAPAVRCAQPAGAGDPRALTGGGGPGELVGGDRGPDGDRPDGLGHAADRDEADRPGPGRGAPDRPTATGPTAGATTASPTVTVSRRGARRPGATARTGSTPTGGTETGTGPAPTPSRRATPRPGAAR